MIDLGEMSGPTAKVVGAQRRPANQGYSHSRNVDDPQVFVCDFEAETGGFYTK